MTEGRAPAVVVDTSAVVAVLLSESGNDEVIDCLESASRRLMSAATRVELGIVIEARLGSGGRDALGRLLRDTPVDIVDVDAGAAERALDAWRRYGRGRHRAGLNYADCFVYALAERTGLPVLCTGDDFAATDLDVIRPPS